MDVHKKIWHIIFFYFVINFVQSEENIEISFPNEQTVLYDNLARCIKKVCDIDLNFRPTIVIDNQQAKNKTVEEFIKNLVNKIMNNIPIVIINKAKNNIFNENWIGRTVLRRNHTVHALTLNYFEFCNDMTLFNSTNLHKEVKYVYLISETFNDRCIKKIKQLRDNRTIDVTFWFIQNKKLAHMFTYAPEIDADTCKQTSDKIVYINSCDNGVLENKKVFPSKMPVNFNKCPLKVGMATLYPFSYIENKSRLKTYDRINQTKGSDMEILKIIAEKFNATLELHYIFRDEENPYADSEFIKFVKNGSLDLCAGGLYRIYGDAVAYSGVYIIQAVVWIYYVERAERSWQNLVIRVDGLYFFIIFYISYSFIWYLVCTFDGDAVCLTNTLFSGWGALVGTTSLQKARTNKQKILNMCYLIMTVHLSAYISIQLYSFLTMREPPQMFNTVDQIMESGRTPFLKASSKYFVNDKKYVAFANTSADCVSFFDCAMKTLKHNGLTIVLQGNFYDFQTASAVDGEARILRTAENIITVYTEMIIRKNGPIALKVPELIHYLFEAGIAKRKYDESIGILVMSKADRANSNMIKNSYSCQAGCSITLRQFAGVFDAWIFGCVLSCGVFVIEMCSQYSPMPVEQYIN